MMGGASRPMRAMDFFGGVWRGEGAVYSLFNQRLRTFRVEFRAAASDTPDTHVLEEQIVYDNGAQLQRVWSVMRDGQGYLGLEPAQGGRMRVVETSGGLRIGYDRPRALSGPNVASLHLTVRQEADGRLAMRGWTRMFGVLPLLRTRVLLVAIAPPSR